MSETSAATPHLSAKLFKLAAVLEAVSWAILLTGMFFKWIVQNTEIGVQIGGPIHGAMFMIYVAVTFWASQVHRWDAKKLVLGLVSAVPPFMTLWFEKHAEKEGLLRPGGAVRAD